MKKFYLLVPFIFLIYLSCEDKKEEDTTPPTVSITSPQDGSTVSDSITITCISSDDEGIEKVELWVSGVKTSVIDNTEPYSLQWSTTTLEDGNYTIIVRSYDLSGNITDSEPIILTVYNTPTEVILWGESYSIINTDFLELYGYNLTGSIPSEIGNLTNLTSLLLFNNQLTGSIPSEIGNLTNLNYLKLQNNGLTGIIPESICDLDMISLSSFDISNNQLCPPYPSCIEDYVGTQDTSGCN